MDTLCFNHGLQGKPADDSLLLRPMNGVELIWWKEGKRIRESLIKRGLLDDHSSPGMPVSGNRLYPR